MRVGLALHFGINLESVRHVAVTLRDLLTQNHQVVLLPLSSTYGRSLEEERHADDIVRGSDVLIGFHSVLMPLLTARARVGGRQRCIVFVLGAMPRGAITIKRLLPYLQQHDVFVVNCSADEELVRRFLPDANVERIALPYSEEAFHKISQAERTEARRELGLLEATEVLLYAGRMSLEKNVHTVLRVVAAVARVKPNVRLLLAGPIQDLPFNECGVAPLQYGRSLEAAMKALQLAPGNVRYVGELPAEQLRSAYNVADVMLNMTLHHDENFGLSQIEAAACGTPVVGSAWGGLRDTIRDGSTGYHVSTSVTPLGVKVNWWEAASKVCRLLTTTTRDRRAPPVPDRGITDEYRRERFGKRLEMMLAAYSQQPEDAAPISVSDFGRQFWEICTPEALPHARYTPGTRSFQLYRELISSYAGECAEAVPVEAALEPEQVVVLAAPVTVCDDAMLVVNDPMYPFRCRLPVHLARGVKKVLRTMQLEPAIGIKRLRDVAMCDAKCLTEAVMWMLAMGLVLRSRTESESLPTRSVEACLGRPSFQIRAIDRFATDFLMFD